MLEDFRANVLKRTVSILYVAYTTGALWYDCANRRQRAPEKEKKEVAN